MSIYDGEDKRFVPCPEIFTWFKREPTAEELDKFWIDQRDFYQGKRQTAPLHPATGLPLEKSLETYSYPDSKYLSKIASSISDAMLDNKKDILDFQIPKKQEEILPDPNPNRESVKSYKIDLSFPRKVHNFMYKFIIVGVASSLLSFGVWQTGVFLWHLDDQEVAKNAQILSSLPDPWKDVQKITTQSSQMDLEAIKANHNELIKYPITMTQIDFIASHSHHNTEAMRLFLKPYMKVN